MLPHLELLTLICLHSKQKKDKYLLPARCFSPILRNTAEHQQKVILWSGSWRNVSLQSFVICQGNFKIIGNLFVSLQHSKTRHIHTDNYIVHRKDLKYFATIATFVKDKRRLTFSSSGKDEDRGKTFVVMNTKYVLKLHHKNFKLLSYK